MRNLSHPLFGVALLLSIAGSFIQISASGAAAPKQTAVTIQAAGRGNPYFNFADGREIPAVYSGSVDAESAIASSGARGLALASADFDEDGMPDLVASFDSPTGGLISLHFGNVDAVYPNTPEARKRRAEGKSVDAPFLPDAKVFQTLERPDFIGAGDFDADGHWDVVTARKGGDKLALHRGDGAGSLLPPESLPLPGAVTVLTTGDVNRRDGLEDVLVGVEMPSGARLLVFEWPEGALRGKPEEIALPEAASDIAVGQLDEEYPIDVAVAAGKDLLIVTGRDRRLTMPRDIRSKAGAVKWVSGITPDVIAAMAIGDYDADGKNELAVLTIGGGLTHFDPRLQYGTFIDVSRPILSLGPGPNSEGWLITAQSSGTKGDELLLMSPAGRSLLLLHGMETVSLDAAHGFAGGLPMRLTPDALTDFVLLSGSSAGLSSLETGPLAILTVTNTNDSGAGSLRQAILDANATPGSDTIAFNIPGAGPHTIQPLSPLPSITAPVMLDGTTEPDFGATPVVRLDGALAGTTAPAIRLTSSGNIIRGLVINRFSRTASAYDAAGLMLDGSNNNKIEGNFIGTDVTGLLLEENVGFGILTLDSSGNFIGGTLAAARNVVSGNTLAIAIGSPAPLSGGTGNSVVGNLIGTGSDGLTVLGNSDSGIEVWDAINTRVGGTTAGSGNIQCDSLWGGIGADLSSGTLIQGNLVGLASDGSTPCGNFVAGIWLGDATSGPGANTVGGTTPSARNVTSNHDSGVQILGDCTGVLVQGNYIGLNAAGTSASGNVGGVFLNYATDCVIGGTVSAARNIISGNRGEGVGLRGITTGNRVIGNYIGTDPSGTLPIPNLRGFTFNNVSGNQIGGSLPEEGNLISGNGIGVWIYGIGSTGNLVGMNRIGTNAAGTAALGNTTGIRVEGSASNNIRDNLVSGNTANGLELALPGATGNTVAGNLIGTDVTGSAALGNGTGIFLEDASSNIIGGIFGGTGNLISGNSNSGVLIRGAGSAGNTLKGNLIGTNILGTAAIPNDIGVVIEDALHSIVGGADPTERNLISGSHNNLVVTAASGTPTLTFVEGNYFGTDVTGTLPLGGSTASNVALEGSDQTTFRGNIVGGNYTRGLRVVNSTGVIEGNQIGVGATLGSIGLSGPGILVQGTSAGIRIGGRRPGAANTIANNLEDGIRVEGTASGIMMQSNSIHSNGGLGIELGSDGVTPNDVGDSDIGPNGLLNFPEISSAGTTGGGVRISGTYSGAPSASYTVDFFASPACDSSGHGEGATFLGSTVVVTDGSGNAPPFLVDLPGSVSSSDIITATAIDPTGNTSEFSACAAVSGVPPLAPTAVEFLSALDISWEPVPGADSYHVYVGALPTLPGLATQAADSCEAAEITSPGGTLPPASNPPPGQMIWFLFTSEGLYGEGAPLPSSQGPRQLTSAGGCGSSCAHSVCDVGGPLTPACTLCASIVCDKNPACCGNSWDAACVQQVHSVCRSLSCPASQGQCAHTLCETGQPLGSGCDAPPLPTSCTSKVCQVKPDCCQQAWDDACVATMASVCGYGCI